MRGSSLPHRLADSDAWPGDHLGLVVALVQLEWGLVERQPVVLARDAERLAETARAGAEEARVIEPAPLTHRVDAVGRLERAQQDCGRHTLVAADEVQAPVDAVGAVDVGVPGRTEH
jgi:hypothetical protein